MRARDSSNWNFTDRYKQAKLHARWARFLPREIKIFLRGMGGRGYRFQNFLTITLEWIEKKKANEKRKKRGKGERWEYSAMGGPFRRSVCPSTLLTLDSTSIETHRDRDRHRAKLNKNRPPPFFTVILFQPISFFFGRNFGPFSTAELTVRLCGDFRMIIRSECGAVALRRSVFYLGSGFYLVLEVFAFGSG